ncbi:MAG: cation diffusion facilitator family transporter [Rikenellaceae bacterium]
MNQAAKSTRESRIYNVTLWGCIVNIILAIAKAAAGIVGRSGAMMADAVHSLSDLASDVVVILFVKLASKPKDEDHHYGHGKYETLATTIIGLSLFVVGVGILTDSALRIHNALSGEVLDQPRPIALIVAALSIIAKELLYHQTLSVGRKVASQAVIANAWHHRTDALSSVGTLVGVACAYFLGSAWRIADPIAAIGVAGLILKVAFELVKVGVDELLERSLPGDQQQQILEIICRNPKVVNPHNLRTRRIGNNIAIEIHIRVDGAMSVNDSHQLTIEIEKNLRASFGEECSVGIHVEPVKM